MFRVCASPPVARTVLRWAVAGPTPPFSVGVWAAIRRMSYVYQSTSLFSPDVDRLAAKDMKKLSLRQFIDFGRDMTPLKFIQSARYVHNELAVRLARQIRLLHVLPFVIMSNDNLRRVHDKYQMALDRLRHFPPIETNDAELQFTDMLRALVDVTVDIVDDLAEGLADAIKRVPENALDVDDFLNNMLISRIGRRVLAEQHIMLHHPRPDFVGIVSTTCSPRKCIEKAVERAGTMAFQMYGDAPEVSIIGATDSVLEFIPYHLEYICTELLKNSFRAALEHCYVTKASILPMIECLIVEGPHELVIRFSDRGGGIPLEDRRNIFRYGFTTAESAAVRRREAPEGVNPIGFFGGNLDGTLNPMHGKGFGLPLSQLYAKHFGGSLDLVTMEGFGTEVYVRLDRTGQKFEQSQC